MNFRKLVVCLSGLVVVSGFVACESEGVNDDGSTLPDTIVVVDYGNTADLNGRDENTVNPDTDQPVDTHHTDTNVPDSGQDHGVVTPDDGNKPDNNVTPDEGSVDVVERDIYDHSCVVPTCDFVTTSYGLKDNCDGTMSDMGSGLMWQKVGRDQSALSAMNNQCGTLYLGCSNGQLYGDWRVPTISEVRTLIHGCPAVEDGGACTVTAECYQTTCVNDACNGCTMNAGPFGGKYIDPIMETVEYGGSYSVVLSGTRTPKTPSDPSDRFYYVQNFNAKLAVVAPLVVHPTGSVFCVRDL